MESRFGHVFSHVRVHNDAHKAGGFGDIYLRQADQLKRRNQGAPFRTIVFGLYDCPTATGAAASSSVMRFSSRGRLPPST